MSLIVKSRLDQFIQTKSGIILFHFLKERMSTWIKSFTTLREVLLTFAKKRDMPNLQLLE